ncbi:KdsC family phosphatase [Hungatella hathewayi]|uniref:KdsC family phosphatase n=1 Tax=Hungatella hathewayi TaxID=154046 RepID=UPI0035657C59
MDDRSIKILVMDVDGTLTDGKIYMTESGECMKAFNVRDGLGIHDILPVLGIIPVVMTGRKSEILARRCDELGVKYLFQGVKNKKETLTGLLETLHISADEAAFIGDDINDLECMKLVKSSACPADAVLKVKEAAGYICSSDGGQGAVREYIDCILTKDQ